MDETKANSGFTLIELIVVISLISIVLFFSIPRFQGAIPTDHTKKVSRWILSQAQMLKAAAVRDQKLYMLNVNIDVDRFWVINESMTEEEIQTAEQSGYGLPGDIDIIDLQFPGKGIIDKGTAQIFFYPNDYSDKVLIHIKDDSNKQLSFLIEPFLPGVKLFEQYVGFEG